MAYPIKLSLYACYSAWKVSIWFFPCCTKNLTEYHCLCKHSLSFIAKHTPKIAWTHFILTVVTPSHANLILLDLHQRRTIKLLIRFVLFSHHISVAVWHRAKCLSLLDCPVFFWFFWELNKIFIFELYT